MSRKVTHDGAGALQIRFPFDRGLVDRIKTLPNRRWNGVERFWWIPETDVVLLVDLLHAERFSFDDATQDLYRGMGGDRALEATVAIGRSTVSPTTDAPLLPGLFDAADASPRNDHEDYTVSRLNERVGAVIEAAFPTTIWLVGEISGFNKNVHRRHVSFELTERDPQGKPLSRIPATLFGGTRQEVERALRRAGDPFRLEDEVTVRLRVRVELYVPWGQYRVIVEDLDVNYTLGEAARRREEIVRLLTEAGLTERNPALPLPALPLRVGVVTSLGSDAYNDVLRTLQESGFAFDVTVHGARVQGHATEPSVLNALDWFRGQVDRFDVVLICRGGGSRTDLIGFDSAALGRAVALMPLPVLVGIGHEKDRSVLDAVARSCKTPTAAAAALVLTVQQSLERLETVGRDVLEGAADRVREERQLGEQRAARLARAARVLLRHELAALAHRRQRTVLGTRRLLASARDRLARWVTLIPRNATLQVERRRLYVRGILRSISQAARQDVGMARRRMHELSAAAGPRASRLVLREAERLEGRARRLQLVDPRRVLERGYAILRQAEGGLVTDAATVPVGERVHADLKRGTLRLRSEGIEDNKGGKPT